MFEGVAIAFGGRGHEEHGAAAPRDFETLNVPSEPTCNVSIRAPRSPPGLPATPDEKRIRDGRNRRAGRHLVAEIRSETRAKVGQIDESSGEKVIGHDDGVAFSQEGIA